MKRSAGQAFGGAAAPAQPPTFQPSGAALLDPKAYFAQLQAASAVVPKAAAPAPAAARAAAAGGAADGGGAASSSGGLPELLEQLQKVSAVRCAGIVKDKGQNFTHSAALEAFHTMALKSSFKLREELAKQPHVRRLCKRIEGMLGKPPPGITLHQLAKAAWCITRFPDDVRGDAQPMLAPAARMLSAGDWDSESAVRLLWCMARSDAIHPHRALLSQVLREFVKDKCQRGAELTVEACLELLFAIARARQHKHEGDHPTVHLEETDEVFIDYIARRVIKEIDNVEVQTLVDLVNLHAEVGLRREKLLKAVCPKIVANTDKVREDTMAKCIKAYRRFMIPLRAEQQGFRTLAVVAKGDFQRPSEKPKFTGKREFDKPQALFPKTQVHGR